MSHSLHPGYRKMIWRSALLLDVIIAQNAHGRPVTAIESAADDLAASSALPPLTKTGRSCVLANSLTMLF